MRPAWIIDDLPDAPEPDDVPCAGWGGLFDLDVFYRRDENDDDGGVLELSAAHAAMISRELIGLAKPALEVCAGCPLANRNWCMSIVDPVKNMFTGVAGGAVWRNGAFVGDIDSVFGIRRAA